VEVGAFFNACLEEDPSQSRINKSTDILPRALNIAIKSREGSPQPENSPPNTRGLQAASIGGLNEGKEQEHTRGRPIKLT